MKKPRLVSYLAALCCAAVAGAVPIESKISAVTVYADRAVVSRVGETQLQAGAAELVFANLPESLVEQSLQFSGAGTAAVTILDVSARRTFLERTANDRLKAAEGKLEALNKEMRRLNDQVDLLNARRAMIDKMEAALTTPGGKEVSRPAVTDLASAMEFIISQRAKVAGEAAELDEQRAELQRKIDAAQAEVSQLTGPGRRAVKTVTVRVNVAEAGSFKGTLAYTVPNARWMPSYDARVASGEKQVDLSYFGVVRQNTGEDWNDVALTLSTARPSLGGAAPTLRPWEIEEFRPRPVARERAVTEFAARQPAMAAAPTAVGIPSDVPQEMKSKDAEFATATVESGATSASFRIAAPADIPTDGSAQKVPIAQAMLAAQPEYLTVPKRQTTAFLTSKVTNNTEFPLLAGMMNVFLDGTFVATSQLRTVMAGEKFDLALGADEGVAVKHKRVQKFTELTGLTNSGTRYTYEYLITIENNKKTPSRVVVHDQLPLARHEKIIVKQISPDAREVKPDNEGLLKWALDLKPGEKRELTVKFTIEHPNDLNVTGVE